MALKLRNERQGAGEYGPVPCRAALLGSLLLTAVACASDPCADALKAKSPAAILPCPERKESMCEYLATKRTDVEVHFSFLYEVQADSNGNTDSDLVEHNRQCIMNHFAKAGVASYPGLAESDVDTVATYPQAVPLASGLAIIKAYDLDCKGAKCEDCMAMTAQQCADTPMCHVVNAWPVDLVRGCMGAGQPMGCIPLAYMETDGLISARDPQGRCWLVEDLNPMPRSFSLWTGDGTCGIPPINGGFFPPLCESPAP